MIAELAKMALWYKLMVTQPLKYLSSLADVSASMFRTRNVTASSSHRPTKVTDDDVFPLDIILNEQKPYHPSKMFSHAALGHTRSFSTTVADRARRFPNRVKNGEPCPASACDSPKSGPRRCRQPKSQSRPIKRDQSRKQSRSQRRKLVDSSEDTPSSSHLNKFSIYDKNNKFITFKMTNLLESQKNQVRMILPKNELPNNEIEKKSRSIGVQTLRPIYQKLKSFSDCRIKQPSLEAPLKAIKRRMWEKWITRAPYNGPLAQGELYGYCLMYKAYKQI